MQTDSTSIEQVRIKYRGQIEKHLTPYQLAAILAVRHPHPTAEIKANLSAIDAASLTKIGRALAGLAVKECNHGLTPRDDKRVFRLQTEAKTLTHVYGLTVTCQGDPRGYVLRIHGEGVPRNNWGDGFGIA